MKKTSIALIVLFVGMALQGFSQTSPVVDFYAGKWEISVVGSPRGDIIFDTNLIRKDGKLTGDLVEKMDTTAAKRPITRVDETEKRLTIYFDSVQAGEIAMELDKIDDDTLEGKIMGYEATARRKKEKTKE